MTTTRLIPGAVLALLFAGNLAAETLDLKFLGGTYTAPGIGFYINPYKAEVTNLPGHPILTIFCDDFSTDIHVNDTWTAEVSRIDAVDLEDARFGPNVAGYTQVAYLLNFLLNPQITTYWRAVYTVATWEIFTPGASVAETYSGPEGKVAFHNDVVAAKADTGWTGYDASAWRVLTDVETGDDRVQEFLIHTPEPSGFLLLGGGLAAIGLARYLRRRRALA